MDTNNYKKLNKEELFFGKDPETKKAKASDKEEVLMSHLSDTRSGLKKYIQIVENVLKEHDADDSKNLETENEEGAEDLMFMGTNPNMIGAKKLKLVKVGAGIVYVANRAFMFAVPLLCPL
jgi:hypothetical protein